MEIPRNNPNQEQPASPIEKAVRAADVILDHLGVEKEDIITKTPDMLSATVGLDGTRLTHVPDAALPTVTINKPIGDFAERARWAYEITYGMQHGGASRHVLVLKGENPSAEMSFYDGRPDRQLTDLEAQEVATDLSRIAEID